MRKKQSFVLASVSTATLCAVIGGLVFGVESTLPLPRGAQQFVETPQAHAWGGSTWRRVRREARRARDRIRRELERARQHAEREVKRTATRAREGNLRINLENVRNQALRRLAAVSAATAPFLPASQIVQLSLAAIDYEAIMREMEALEINPAEIAPVRQRLDLAEDTLRQLENVRVDQSTPVGSLPAPRESVQSATVARLEMEHVTEYMAQLFLEAAVYQELNGQIPNRRPVTLIYKIGQALVDYAQLKKDIELISLTQSEYAGLYRELIERGRGESIAPLLMNALTHLETMPVSGAPDPVIDPASRVGRLIGTADALVERGDRLLADQYVFPLMEAPTQDIATMTTTLREMTHDPRNTATAWILLLPQHEVDALDSARGRLERTRTGLQAMHVYTPQELVGLFFLQAMILWPKYQAVPPGPLGPEHAVLALEIREIHDHLGDALQLVESRGLSLPRSFANNAKRALANLRTAAQDLERRSQTGTTASSEFSTSSRSTTPMSRTKASASAVSIKGKSKSAATLSSAKATTSSSLQLSPVIRPSSIQVSSSQSAYSASAMMSVSFSSMPSSSSATAILTAPRIMQPAANPYDSLTSTVTIVGYPDTRSAQILINGNVIAYTPGAGKFSATVGLVPGKNVITVESIDADGGHSPASTLIVHYIVR